MVSNVQEERLGIAAVEKEVAAAGWFFREQPLPDEGVDAQIEGADLNGRPTAVYSGYRSSLVGTTSRTRPGGGWRCTIKRNNLAYWWRRASGTPQLNRRNRITEYHRFGEPVNGLLAYSCGVPLSSPIVSAAVMCR
jgi:Domain of unknown function (DUF4365)